MSHQEKLPGLQIARALAALSIVYFHSWTILDRFPKGTAHPIPTLEQYGWIGVDLFFAISGYVICLVVAKPTFSPIIFLIKRALRIYPIWILTLSAFAVLAWMWRGLQPTETLIWFLYSVTLLPTNGFPFYDIGWSLQHEMLFYVVACLIVPMAGVWGLAAFLALSTTAFHLLPLPWFPANFAMYHAEFLAGVLVFMIGGRYRFGAAAPLVIGCALLWFFIVKFGGRYFFPIALFFLILGFVNIRSGRLATAISTLGDASYSMYLLHPIIFSIAKAFTLPIAAAMWAEEPIRFASFVVVIAAALASWHLFERPMMQIGARLSNAADRADATKFA